MYKKSELLESGVQYPEEIEQNSKTLGYKAANLLFLDKLLTEIKSSSELKVIIPTFTPIPHQLIKEHLNNHSNESNGWLRLFEEFQKAYENQGDKKTLEANTVEILHKLQRCISKCFVDHPLELSELPKELQASGLFMVRSTGINEDKVDMANPGGNESLPSDTKGISQAIGKVVASYLSEKSILQRLKAGDEHISDIPVMPVLIQALVGEGLEQLPSDSKQKVVSGVIYTNGGAIRIQSAPGHGEYVVNSKGLTDNYYISKEGIIYSEIRPKNYRLIPEFNSADNEIQLRWKPNDSKEVYSSSLPTEVVHALQKAANQIEASYKMRMDIEFVYDAKQNVLNIVQARPIPAGKRKNLEPSALSPQYLANPQQTLQTINALQVVTPEVNAAAVITDSSQVIACKDIKDALHEYLKPGNVNRDIRAVIVQNYTPDNSHEAGQFNLNSLPVIQVADLSIVERILKEKECLIVVDPQHSRLYQMAASLRNGNNDPILVEKSLYEAKILEKGIFASTLSAYITPQEFNFNHKALDNKEASAKPLEQAMLQFKSGEKKLGELVNLAEKGDKHSLDLLLSAAYEAMSYHVKAKQGNSSNSQDPAPTPSQKMKYNLEQLDTPVLGDENERCKTALAQILRTLSNIRKSELITSKVFKQSLIAGSEMAILLSRMEDTELKTQDKKIQDGLYLEYFNIKRKFEGCITGIGNKNVLVDSVQTDLLYLKHQKKIEDLAQKEQVNLDKWDESQKTILYEVSRLSASSPNASLNEQWQKFCLDVCASEVQGNKLAAMIVNLVKLDIHEQWLTLFFTRAYKIHKGDSLQVLNALSEDLNQVDFQSVKESQRIIAELDAQIPRWADKGTFDRLYKELESNLSQLDKLLKYDNNLSNCEQFIVLQNTKKFIDVMDKTIKSLGYSLDYEDKEDDHELRAGRVRKMLIKFRDCLSPWLLNAYPLEDIQRDRFHKQLTEALERSLANDKNKISSSLNFDVRQTIVADTKGSSDRRSPYSLDLSKCKTLEDCFTCIHQNFNSAVDQIEKQQGLIMKREFYPPLLAQFEEELMKLKGKKMGNNGTPISNPIISTDRGCPLIYYRIPLSFHNGTATVFRSPKDDKYYLQFSIGSPFSEEMHRWRIISAKADFDLISLGVERTSYTGFNHESSYQYSSNFCVPLSKQNIPSLLKIIEQAIAGTYHSSYSVHSSEDEKRFLLLENMDDNSLKMASSSALSLISHGFFINTHYFNTNTSERIKVLHKLIQFKSPADISIFERGMSDEAIRLKTIANLLLKSPPGGRKSFFSHLYTNPEFDDSFCTELTGYSKIEFSKMCFYGTEYKEKVQIYQLCYENLKDSAIELILKNDNDAFKDATRYGDEKMLKWLIQSGIDVNQALNEKGDTALMYLVQNKVPDDLVRLLVSAGADLNIKNSEGKTVFDLTENQEILSLLEPSKALKLETQTSALKQKSNPNAFFSGSLNDDKVKISEAEPDLIQKNSKK